jgi:tetratricopeptide (TPR) repeat protein
MNRVAYWISALLLAALPAAAFGQTAAVAEGTADVSLDPATAGIAAVNRAADLLKSQGPDAAIAYFVDALNQARNFAVQRAIRFQLADLYSQSGRPDKALEVLKDQIASIPPVAPPTQVEIVPTETTGNTAAPGQ